MFGSEFSSSPEILLSSFQSMNKNYKSIGEVKKDGLLYLLQKGYIRLFGVPEIGFQIRSLYFKNAIEKITAKKINKVLDAGSGIGIYALWLAKKYPKAQVVGGEIDKNKLEFSSGFSKKQKIPNAKFEYLDITKSPRGREKFDLIINIDVLEHVENYKNVLKNFYKLLTPRGYLFIHTPQPNQKRIFNVSRGWSHEDHIREGYASVELKNELQKLGFRIIELRETSGFFGKLTWELNHLSFKKGFILAGLVYPFLYVLATLDLFTKNKDGLGTAILAKKNLI